MPVTRTRLVLLAVVCIAVPAVFVTTGFGRDRGARHAHVAKTGAVFGKPTVSAAASSAGFVYVRANGTLAPGNYGQIVLTCPRKYPHPIAGLFDTNSDLTLHATSRPDPDGVSAKKARKWAEGVTNTGQTQAGVTVGVVCLK